MKKINLFIILTIGLFFLLSGFSVYLFIRETQQEPLPLYGKIDDFELITSKGDHFNLERLNNKIWVADFFFTTCGSICPIMTKNMADLHKTYRSMNDVEFVSISVNPEQDTPDILKQYANKYQIDTNKWHFLTGSRESVKNLAVNSFKIGSISEPIFHSAHFVLVDRKAHIRGYYDGTLKEDVMKLSQDLSNLLKEK